MRNPGKIYEVIDGVHKGRFAIARDKAQKEIFWRKDKLFVEWYEGECPATMEPVIVDGLQSASLVGFKRLKFIGYAE